MKNNKCIYGHVNHLYTTFQRWLATHIFMVKDREVIIAYSIGCAVFSANMVVALMVGSVGHAAQWAFMAFCFGVPAYRVWRRRRNELQNKEENNGGA